MALSDSQIEMALDRIKRLHDHRLRNRQDTRYIDIDMVFPGIVMADVEAALQELQEVRRQNAWVRQQLDPSWSSPAKT